MKIASSFRNGIQQKPYDSRVEWLESTGTQWIDTGITYADENTKFIINMKFGLMVNTQSSYGGFGIYNPSPDDYRFHIWSYNGYHIGCGRYGNYWSSRTSIDQEFHKFVLNGMGNCKFDNTDVNLVQIPHIDYNFNLFSLKNAGNIDRLLSGMRVSHFTHIQNSQVVHDFIPVRVGNVGYMYDKVSHKLFGNSGTGSFVLGNDII